MKFSGLDRLLLEVNNLEQSLEFYRDVLGFDVASDNSEAETRTASLKAGKLTITLAEHLETMLRRGRGVHFFIGVDDVDSFYELVRNHLPNLQAPVDEGWGGRFITVEDPDKYRFFFVTWDEPNS